MRAIDADELKERIRKSLGIKSLDNLLQSEKTIVKQIDMTSTIQPEPHWIPTSERSPKIYENVLLSYFDEVTIGWLNGDGSWSIYDGWQCVSADEISAWLPLPKVFKENERESN